MKRSQLKRTGFKKPSLEKLREKQLKRNPKLIGYGILKWGKDEPIDVLRKARKMLKKASKSKPKKKVNITLLKKKLWELTKQKVRAKYLDHRGYAPCYTCDRVLTEKKDMHTAHFIDSSVCGAILRYSMDNLRICCYACNVHKNGNKIEYYRRMVNEIGQAGVDEIYRLSKTLISADTYFYEKMIENYKKDLTL